MSNAEVPSLEQALEIKLPLFAGARHKKVVSLLGRAGVEVLRTCDPNTLKHGIDAAVKLNCSPYYLRGGVLVPYPAEVVVNTHPDLGPRLSDPDLYFASHIVHEIGLGDVEAVVYRDVVTKRQNVMIFNQGE
ncbi:MAG TPA: hypothetical protein VF598_09510 [Hymenobacter sp.]|jgi:hypothetical protein